MTSIRILADENIPRSVISWFRERHYDIVSTEEVDLNGANDSALVGWAAENRRVILTLDEDFVRLYRGAGGQLGIIVVRTHPSTPDRVVRLLSSSLSEFRIEKHPKDLIVITEKGIRISTH